VPYLDRIVSEAVAVTPLAVALSVTTVFRLTFDVPTPNVARVSPAGITTVAGTLAAAVLLLASSSVTPASLETVTVAFVVKPSLTVLLAKVNDVGTGGGGGALAVIVIGAEVEAAPKLSVTVRRAV
jgi:hypothetical protein